MLKVGKALSLVFVGGSVLAFASTAAAQGGYAGISAGQAEVSDFCDDVIIECDDSALRVVYTPVDSSTNISRSKVVIAS